MVKKALAILKQAAIQFHKDQVLRLSAALSFYAMVSLSPLTIVTVALAGTIWSRDAVADQLVTQMRTLVGEDGAQVASMVIRNAAQQQQRGPAALTLGLLTLVFGATGVFVQLQETLNTIWDVKPDPRGRFFAFLRKRLLSAAMIAVVGFLLLVLLIVSAATAAAGAYVREWLPLGGLTHLLEFATSLAIVTVLLAMVYKFLPDAKIAWRHVWGGALFTAILFAIGKFAIGLYLGQSSFGSAYGAAGSLVVFLVWLYYSSIIVFFGAECTQIYARLAGEAEPLDHAVSLHHKDSATGVGEC